MSRRHYIYLITNKVNGKKYVGQHVTPCNTVDEMLNDRYMGSGTLLLAAFKKYGRKNFTKEIIHIANSQREADVFECRIIEEWEVLKNRNDWYNRAAGGQYDRSEKHSEIMSEIMNEVANRPDVKKKILQARVASFGYESIDQWQQALEEKKKQGMRLYLINTLRARRNQLEREYLQSKEGKKLLNEYRKECANSSLALSSHNDWQRSEEGRAAMKRAVANREAKRHKGKYTPIQLDILLSEKGMTTAEAAKKIGIDRSLLGQMRRGMQTMRGKRVPRYVRDDVFESIQNA